MNDLLGERGKARELLQRALGDPSAEFRKGQWEAIDALVSRRRKLLVVQRTGWGKSAIYFVATRLLRDRGAGPTLIVSPLLALMRNQIGAAKRLGIRALSINSSNRSDWPSLKDDILENRADAILVSPERLANDDFVQKVLLPVSQRLGLLVVDEAHCISDWGHDFRPDYRRLVNLVRRMPPNMPVLATTATASDRVVRDICAQVGDIDVQRGALARESLMLQTLRLPDQAARLAWLAAHLNELPGTGIVYTLTRRDADQVAGWLQTHGIAARAYYSDVAAEALEGTKSYREHLEGMLLRNEIKALVATTALGLGFDKPDLGFVVHYQAPGSILAYYQQVGRAGRAIPKAVGVLLSGREDADIHEYFRRTAFPDEQHVDAVLEALAKGDGLTERQIEESVNLGYRQIEKVLKLLSVESPAPIIKDAPLWRRTPVHYRLDRERIQRLTRRRAEEWREMQRYIDSPDCLMRFLAAALDDERHETCGRCSPCLGRPVVAPDFPRGLAADAARYLRRSELPFQCRKRVAAGAFSIYGFRGSVPAELRPETGRILSRWGDAGWGSAVAEDKHVGRFREELVQALVEMVRDRWRPHPAPSWIACVPSRVRPALVPDLAARLAVRLRIPFRPVVTKVRENQPQKLQQNRYHQCRNLDGVFSIGEGVPAGPVLLVDDVVDSGWTMTVVAALLRQAGSGPVWPVALATTSMAE